MIDFGTLMDNTYLAVPRRKIINYPDLLSRYFTVCLSSSQIFSIMPNHFYTHDPKGHKAPKQGYIPEGSVGYVYHSPQAGIVPVYRFYNEDMDNDFYTQDPKGEIALQLGYKAKGISWYMYSTAQPNTVALRRFFGHNDHFYTTNPEKDVTTNSGYKEEGILGYISLIQQKGTGQLFRWWRNPRVQLDGVILTAWCLTYPELELRKSTLNLDYCLSVYSDNKLAPWKAPMDPFGPYVLSRRLSDDAKNVSNWQKYVLTKGDGLIINCKTVRWGLFGGESVYESDLDLKSFLRWTRDGHIEFVHP
jgi:hypothetical protein